MLENGICHQYLRFSTLLVCIYRTASWETCVVIWGKPAVTWLVASTNQRHSTYLVPHFTFRITQFHILPIAHRHHRP